MKCPKCQYLGFETGDRCKNCGYDFSLIEFRPGTGDEIRPLDRQPPGAAPEAWDHFENQPDIQLRADVPLHDRPADVPAADAAPDAPLPLFALTAEDQPLVRLPVTPRRPLAVRRTPVSPRFRTVPKAEPAVEPELDFPEEASLRRAEPAPTAQRASTPILSIESVPPVSPRRMPVTAAATLPEPTSARRRCIAAAIDYALLFGIDLTIIYFTARMAGLDVSSWHQLPKLPMALFLGVIALAYVGVFTAIGGQTIGKMAARIRVIADDPGPVNRVHAVRRTAAVALSWLTGGLGFLPVLVGDHRALHDRLSRTRVVDLESA